jgi:hypothetical protein
MTRVAEVDDFYKNTSASEPARGYPITGAHCAGTPWSRVLLEKLTVRQLVKNHPPPPFHGMRKFATTFTTAHH